MQTTRALIACTALVLVMPHAIAQDATAKKPVPKAAAKAGNKGQPEQPDRSTIGTGRDWTKIDTNKDSYISPDEMEVWLKANPATPAK
jgi:hypothetical protein